MAAAPSFVLEGKHLKQGDELPAATPGLLRIYSMKFCPFAQRTRLVAAHKNIPHEIVNVALAEKPNWFLKKNPKGTTPAVEIDGKALYDSIVASDFLDDLSSENPLHPTDPYRKARDRLRVEKYCSKLFAYYPMMFDKNPANVRSKTSVIVEGFEELNMDLPGTFFGGESPSMLDFMVFPVVEKVIASSMGVLPSLREAVNLEKHHPKVAQWYKAMQETAAHNATSVPLEQVSDFLEGYAQHKPQYDM